MLGVLTMWLYLKGRIKKPKIVRSNILKHFHETLIYFVPTIASSIYSVLDKTLIGVITDSANENGYYEQATKVAFMAKAVTFGALNGVMMSRQSYLFSLGRFSEMKERIDRSIDTIMFIGIGVCMGVIGIANTFVPLFFGAGYEPVVFLMQLIIPVILFSGVGDCIGSQYYNPSGLRAKSARYIVAGAFLNLICNLILIPRFGSVGAAIGTLVAEFFIACLYVSNCNGFLKLSQILNKVWKRFIAGLLMALVIMQIPNIDWNNVLTIIVQCIIGTIVYLLLLWIMKDSFLTYLLKDVVYSKIRRK
jgi:O-antigen/teichoic acid export membrane protein